MSAPVTLHIWSACDGLPSSSPFCVKVMKALAFKKIPYVTKVAAGGRAPAWVQSGKLPAAEIGLLQIEDSTRILKALDEEFPDSPRLYPADRWLNADTLVLEEWADSFLELYVPFYRWHYLHHFQPFSRQIFEGIPSLLRRLIGPRIRKSVLSSVADRGLGLESAEARVSGFREALGILEARLARNSFLVMPSPTAADFAVYSSLRSLINSKIHELVPMIESNVPLMKWLTAMEALS